MTDELSKARQLVHTAESAGDGHDMTDSELAQLVVQLAIANALISLASDTGKIALLLRQRLKK